MHGENKEREMMWNLGGVLIYKNYIVLKVGALLDLVYTGVCHDPGHLDQSGELALLSLYK